MPRRYARPYRRRARKYSRKYRARKGSRKGKSYTTVVRPTQGPFAQRTIATLKYAGDLARTITAGSLDDYMWALNGLYDPDITGTGHQPYGFDEYMGIYQQYRVISARWRITYPGSSDTLKITHVANNKTTAYTSASLIAETKGSFSKMLPYNGGSTIVMRGKRYLPKVLGLSPVEYKTEPAVSGDSSANPAVVGMLHAMVYNPGSGSVSYKASVEIWFTVEFFDPVQFTQS